MMDEERKQQIRQFLACLDGLSKAVMQLNKTVQRQTEMIALLFDAITKKDEGLISALDDTIEANESLQAEMNALRQDLSRLLLG
jgi:uncharacterized protein (DUF1778 family)